MKKISFIFGTRPEAIKLAPIILELKKHSEVLVNVCITAQHRTMLDQVLEVFEIVPDVDLNLMKPNQTLQELTTTVFQGVTKYLEKFKPNIVIVQGDTTTVFATALAAFYLKIPVAHVEAGLRTGDKYSPFPEEMNRKLTTHIAEYHFAPTERARNNLLREGVNEKKIFVTDNTVIDALLMAVKKIGSNDLVIKGLDKEKINKYDELILITGHRRENFGENLKNICEGIAQLAEIYPNFCFVYPVHLNPNVKKPVFEILGKKSNIFLIEPLGYLPFVKLMQMAKIILTDSGGIQEEAPSLGKPVLVMREKTERQEAVETNAVKLIGTSKEQIIREVKGLLENELLYNQMSKAKNPYGNGMAAKKIVNILLKI